MTNILNMDVGSMFGKKDEEEIKQATLDQESEQLIKNSPVETMHYDLDPSKKPALPSTPQSTPDLSRLENNTFSTPPKAETENPFVFSPSAKKTPQVQEISVNTPTPPTETPPTDETKNPINPQENPSPTPQKSSSAKIFALLFSFLVIIALAGGGYYYWTLQQKPEEIVIDSEIEIPEITIPEVPTSAPVIPEVSNPQYMNFDFQNATAVQIIDGIKKYASDFIASGKITAQEFVVSDLQNNPVSFATFSQKLGLKFSPEISANLSETFSIFLYNDNGIIGLGLSIISKNDALLKTALLTTEKDLISDINPLLIAKPNGEIDKNQIVFNAGTYKEAATRYFNLPPFSLDYTVSNGRFVIGTTWKTFHAVIDALDEEISANTPENSAPSLPVPILPTEN